jgi:hypothetical protein
MKICIVLLFITSTFLPSTYGEIPREQITIYIGNDETAKIMHKINSETFLSNILVQPLSNKISKILAFDENNVLLKTHPTDNQIRIDTLGASKVTLSYDATLVTKNDRIWRLEYESIITSTVVLPAASKIISLNTIPLDIVDDTYVMPAGNILISFTIEPLKTHRFVVREDGNSYPLVIITSANIENFIQESKSLQFDTDDNVPILAVVPKTFSSTYQVLFNNEKIEFNEFNQNSTHYWIRMETPTPGTFLITQLEESQTTNFSEKGDGCFIATATYGSELAPQVQMLREIRDNVLFETSSGTTFMTGFNQLYYSFSPTIAEWERQNSLFKEAVKISITPLITTLSILNYVDIDSEAKIIGYGIGIILLNIGMYFVAPVFVLIKIKTKLPKN